MNPFSEPVEPFPLGAFLPFPFAIHLIFPVIDLPLSVPDVILGNGLSYSPLNQLETHPENSFLIVVADDFERTDFGSILYVCPYAQTFVIISYFHNAYGLRCIFRQALEVETVHRFLLGDEFGRDVQVLRDHFVHLCLYLLDFLFGRSRGKGKVELAFLAFDMSRYRPAAAEQIDHGTVDDVFAGMHGRIFLLVVFIELNFLFHK